MIKTLITPYSGWSYKQCENKRLPSTKYTMSDLDSVLYNLFNNNFVCLEEKSGDLELTNPSVYSQLKLLNFLNSYLKDYSFNKGFYLITNIKEEFKKIYSIKNKIDHDNQYISDGKYKSRFFLFKILENLQYASSLVLKDNFNCIKSYQNNISISTELDLYLKENSPKGIYLLHPGFIFWEWKYSKKFFIIHPIYNCQNKNYEDCLDKYTLLFLNNLDFYLTQNKKNFYGGLLFPMFDGLYGPGEGPMRLNNKQITENDYINLIDIDKK